MKVLLHICCGPCAIGPVEALRREGFEVAGFFYNPNITPYEEYQRRYAAVVETSARLDLDVIYHRYDHDYYLSRVGLIQDRVEQHLMCWRIRLEETAHSAVLHNIFCFTTTLLGSPHQDIKAIAKLGEKIAGANGLNFLVRNFRKEFSGSHRASREWKLYHQDYCGCALSEKERIKEQEQKKGEEPR